MSLPLRDPSTCHYDQISLGEVMLRLDPGEGRIRTARHFTAWEGGGEYNTSRGLRKCFGHRNAQTYFGFPLSPLRKDLDDPIVNNFLQS